MFFPFSMLFEYRLDNPKQYFKSEYTQPDDHLASTKELSIFSAIIDDFFKTGINFGPKKYFYFEYINLNLLHTYYLL